MHKHDKSEPAGEPRRAPGTMWRRAWCGRRLPAAVLATLGLAFGGAACEDNRTDAERLAVEQDAQDGQESNAATANPRPTTRELMETQRVPTDLQVAPLRLALPPGWKVETRSAGGSSIGLLSGPTPHGFVRMTINAPSPIEPEIEATMLEAAAGDDPTGVYEGWDEHARLEIGGMPTIEKRRVGEMTEIVGFGADGELSRVNARPVRWTFIVFTNDGEGRLMTNLAFDAFPLDVYEQDEAFLRGVIESVDRADGAITPALGEPLE